MTTLMAYAGPVDARALVTRTGGIPLVSVGFSWPVCASCSEPMQFLAQLLLGDLDPHTAEVEAGGRGILSVFMCENQEGQCDAWDPASGANQALVFPGDGLTAALVPDHGSPLLPEVCGIERVTVSARPITTGRAASGPIVRGDRGGKCWANWAEPPCGCRAMNSRRVRSARGPWVLSPNWRRGTITARR